MSDGNSPRRRVIYRQSDVRGEVNPEGVRYYVYPNTPIDVPPEAAGIIPPWGGNLSIPLTPRKSK